MMHHYFWTRIAVDSHLVNQKIPRRSHEDTEKAIALWHSQASKFYERQTVSANFTVCLMYSPSYQYLMDCFQWPDYVQLTTLQCYDWFPRHVRPGAEVTMSRLDCDDSFSIDLFEYLNELPKLYDKHTLILYFWVRQYHVARRQLTKPLFFKTPQFATIYYPEFPRLEPVKDDGRPGKKTMFPTAPFYGIVGNHGKYPQQPHVDAPGVYALMRETGINVVNKVGSVGRGMVRPEFESRPDPRFVGCPVG